jgi:hypothetical protein
VSVAQHSAYRFWCGRSLGEEEALALAAIPGVRVGDGRYEGTVKVPMNAGPIAQAVLAANGGFHSVDPIAIPEQPKWSHVRARLEAQGEVREWVYDFATDYQKIAVTLASERLGFAFWHPPGAGKTLSMILWALYSPRPVVIITKAATRGQWAQQVERFTHVKPYVIRPASQLKRKKTVHHETLDEYLARCKAEKLRPFIILGWESLPAHVDQLLTLRGVSLGFDEQHKMKGKKRSIAELQPDGTNKYYDAKNVVSSAAKLSKAAARRLGTTATPVKDRIRDLWGQLDGLEPWAWGSYREFTKRYAGGKESQLGGWWDDRGLSNWQELVGRIAYVTHRMQHKDTHRNLPPKRRQSVYVPHEEQSKGWSQERYNKELKQAQAAGGGSRILEVRLAAAAAGKKDTIVDLVADALEAGQKVVVFDARKDHVDALHAALAKRFTRVDGQDGAPLIRAAYGAGGKWGTTPEQREQIRVEYMARQGASCIIGTGEAWGTGYDLQDTDLAIFAALPWTPGDLQQWEGRFSRLGQLRPVLLLFVIAEGTADQQVANTLIEKLPAVERVAGDVETATAYSALAGTDDKEKLAASILAQLEAIESDNLDDD